MAEPLWMIFLVTLMYGCGEVVNAAVLDNTTYPFLSCFTCVNGNTGDMLDGNLQVFGHLIANATQAKGCKDPFKEEHNIKRVSCLDEEVCGKLSISNSNIDIVVRTCISKQICSIKEDVWSNYGVNVRTECCHDNLCNASSMEAVSWIVVLITVIMTLV